DQARTEKLGAASAFTLRTADSGPSPPDSRGIVSTTAGSQRGGRMNWISRKIHLYNVTMGLYMLDWWERYLFNILILVLLWFIFHNGSRSAAEFYNGNFNSLLLSSSYLKSKVLSGQMLEVRGNVTS
ncbi:unnamed protein product, partial [Musa acuminata subsp. burmannicoides]